MNLFGFRNAILLLLLSGAAVLLVSPAFAGTGVTISAVGGQSYYLGEKIVLKGSGPDAGTVYLYMTGPNLPAPGVSLTAPKTAVIGSNPDTFTAVKTKPDKTWEYSFNTANLKLDAGAYDIVATSQPEAKDQPGPDAASIRIIIKRPYTGVTVSAVGDQSYYLGEKVVLRGLSPDADTVYLFLTGPNLQATGVQLSSPGKAVVSGNPDTFTIVKTNPDKTWEYSFYTANLPVDAGSYTLYAVGRPEAMDQLGPGAANIRIILKKPFITANLSTVTIAKGVLFTVSGSAEGNPPAVQIWILGDNSVFTTTTPVNADASFTFNGDAQLSGKLPEGRCYLIVQHSMQNNRFDIDVSGDYVRNLNLNNGTNLFRITGPGSLQGGDAADALVAAFSDEKAHDDTYTIIPFQVSDAGGSAHTAPADPTTTAPAQIAQTPLIPFALIGAVVLVLGIVVWKRQ
jgi:hypothetical protein